MSIEAIHRLRKRSEEFVANLDIHIATVIEHNEKLLQLNKAQLKRSRNAKGTPLVNKKTGSANLSPAYAKRKGKTKPDLFDTGAFYREMDIVFREPGEYFIIDFVDYTANLEAMYDNIFGIKDKKKAQKITVPEFQREYIKHVLK